MKRPTRSALRRLAPVVVSGSLVLAMGAVGLAAGRSAGEQALAAHRADRLELQRTLAGLTGLYPQVTGGEMLDTLRAQSAAGASAWSPTPGAAASVARLRALSVGSRAVNAGAVLISPTGTPLASYSPAAALPAPEDPGWAPLRAAAVSGRHTLPVSGVLHAGGAPLDAVAVPVHFSDNTTGLVIGLTNLRTSALQRYVQNLAAKDGRQGFVVDGRGFVIAGPDTTQVGRPLPYPAVLAALRPGSSGITDVSDAGTALVVSYAAAGDTGWTALTVQDRGHFLGPLERSSRRAQVALVVLLVVAGSGLVALHRRREAALRAVAVRDDLTGLLNRRGWFELANHELQRAKRDDDRRGLLFLDLDGLKQINDTLGHREGDRAIAEAAALLRRCSRSCDVLGRLGGDEFVLLLGEDSAAGVVRERIQQAITAYNAASEHRFELRLSIGAEIWYPDDACSLDELVRRADAVMYQDKTSRPGRHVGLLRLPEPRASEGTRV